MGRGKLACCALIVAFVSMMAAPAASRAQTFLNPTDITIPGTYTGPATPYPSSISVGGLSGTVSRASVLLLDVDVGDRLEGLDLVLVGPNGAKIMLWSDACGAAGPVMNRDYGFEDSASMFLSDPGPCPAGTYRPSNYEDPATDNLSAGGAGPSPPYTNSLSAFNGASPNGTWSLFAFSDTSLDFITFGGWALTLAVQPSAATPPAATTGQRAAALAKCKKKKRRKARRKCKRRAQLLPL